MSFRNFRYKLEIFAFVSYFFKPNKHFSKLVYVTVKIVMLGIQISIITVRGVKLADTSSLNFCRKFKFRFSNVNQSL